MKIVTVILARAKYCRRIPQKPLVDFLGKHLIEWTLDFAVKLNYETYIYSDLKKMEEVCSNYNVNYRQKMFESKEGTHRTIDELLLYNEEFKADVMILLQATSPFRSLLKIKKWIKNFIENDYDVGFTVNKFNKYVYNEKGTLINCENRGYNKNLINYTENGSFYIFKISQLQKPHITDANNKMLFIDDYDIDIDTPENLDYAKFKYGGKLK